MVSKKQAVGIDEAGRGPLAGPVVAAAVILPQDYDLPGLTDSKKLTEKQRESLFIQIQDQALSIGVAVVDAQMIDSLNIHRATLLAMKQAYEALTISVMIDEVLVDGRFCPDIKAPCRAIIQGDLLEPVISAASVIAKVTRDRLLAEYDILYPQYGFKQHKGYGTALHNAALQQYGPCAIHRRSYAPVRAALASKNKEIV